MSRGSTKTTLADRFRRYVTRDDVTGCLLWHGNMDTRGVGNFYVGAKRATKPARAVAWELEHGPVPIGFYVAAKCVDARCVEPSHAELRERVPKLSPDDVREIRRAHAAGESLSALARRFALAPSSTHAILHGFTHKGV